MPELKVGISVDEASAPIQFDSTDGGVLIPRMTTAQRDAIASPATGLLIFNTTTGRFEFYTGAAWEQLTTASASGDVTGPGSSTDNAVARFDGAGGKTIQNSGVIIDDNDNINLGGNELRNFREQDVTVSPTSPYDIDWATATLFEITLSEDTTFTFSSLLAGRSVTLVLIQDPTGGWSVTWPASVDWPGGTAPTLTASAGAVDVITLFVRADGSTVYGFEAGLNMS